MLDRLEYSVSHLGHVCLSVEYLLLGLKAASAACWNGSEHAAKMTSAAPRTRSTRAADADPPTAMSSAATAHAQSTGDVITASGRPTRERVANAFLQAGETPHTEQASHVCTRMEMGIGGDERVSAVREANQRGRRRGTCGAQCLGPCRRAGRARCGPRAGRRAARVKRARLHAQQQCGAE